jgi:hypothetical protein
MGPFAVMRGSASVCLTIWGPQPEAARPASNSRERQVWLLKDVRTEESIGAFLIGIAASWITDYQKGGRIKTRYRRIAGDSHFAALTMPGGTKLAQVQANRPHKPVLPAR